MGHFSAEDLAAHGEYRRGTRKTALLAIGWLGIAAFLSFEVAHLLSTQSPSSGPLVEIGFMDALSLLVGAIFVASAISRYATSRGWADRV